MSIKILKSIGTTIFIIISEYIAIKKTVIIHYCEGVGLCKSIKCFTIITLSHLRY